MAKKLYTKAELAAIIREDNPNLGFEKLPDDAVLAKISQVSGGDEFLAHLAPEPVVAPPPPPPTAGQQMKDLAARAMQKAKGILPSPGVPVTDIKIPAEVKKPEIYTPEQIASVQPKAPSAAQAAFKSSIGEIATAGPKPPNVAQMKEMGKLIWDPEDPYGVKGMQELGQAARLKGAGVSVSPEQDKALEDFTIENFKGIVMYPAAISVAAQGIRWYIANKTLPGSIRAAREAIARGLRAKGVPPEQATRMADEGMTQAAAKSETAPTIKEFVELRKRAEKGFGPKPKPTTTPELEGPRAPTPEPPAPSIPKSELPPPPAAAPTPAAAPKAVAPREAWPPIAKISGTEKMPFAAPKMAIDAAVEAKVKALSPLLEKVGNNVATPAETQQLWAAVKDDFPVRNLLESWQGFSQFTKEMELGMKPEIKPAAAPAAPAPATPKAPAEIVSMDHWRFRPFHKEIIAKYQAMNKADLTPAHMSVIEGLKNKPRYEVTSFTKEGADLLAKELAAMPGKAPAEALEVLKLTMAEKAPAPAISAQPATFKADGVEMQIIEPTLENFKDMSREDMEDYIMLRHAKEATQAELDKLTSIYADKVPKEELRITEADIIEAAEQNGDEEGHTILRMYHNYLRPEIKPEQASKMRKAMAARYEVMTGEKLSETDAMQQIADMYKEAEELVIQHKTLKDLVSIAKEKPGKPGRAKDPDELARQRYYQLPYDEAAYNKMADKRRELSDKFHETMGTPEHAAARKEGDDYQEVMRKFTAQEAKKFTEQDAFEVAKNHIRISVYRGESIADIRRGQSGHWGEWEKAQIGGRMGEKMYNTNFIPVKFPDGRYFVFKLQDAFNAARAELTGGETGAYKLVASGVEKGTAIPKQKAAKEVIEVTEEGEGPAGVIPLSELLGKEVKVGRDSFGVLTGAGNEISKVKIDTIGPEDRKLGVFKLGTNHIENAEIKPMPAQEPAAPTKPIKAKTLKQKAAELKAEIAGVVPTKAPLKPPTPPIPAEKIKYPTAKIGEEDARLLQYKPKSQVRVMMSPDDYLKWAETKKGWSRDFNKRKVIEAMKERIKSGAPTDALYIDYNPFTKEIYNQEGRHRAIAAKELGVEKVPVIIFLQDAKGTLDAATTKYNLPMATEPWPTETPATQAAPQPAVKPGKAEKPAKIGANGINEAHMKGLVKTGKRNRSIPILNYFMVKGGRIYSTDLEQFTSTPTTLPDGVYALINKNLVKTSQTLEDYPIVPEIDNPATTEIVISKGNLDAILKHASKEDNRHFLNGGSIQFVKGKGRIVSTDGKRLMVVQIPGDFKGIDGKMIIPNETLKLLRDMGAGRATLTINKENIGSGTVKFNLPNGAEIITRLVEGNFPDYEQIIPKTVNTALELDRAAVEQAVNELYPYTKKPAGHKGKLVRAPLKMEFTNKGLIFSVENTIEGVQINEARVVPFSKVAAGSPSPTGADISIAMPLRSKEGEGPAGIDVDIMRDAVDSYDGNKLYIYLNNKQAIEKGWDTGAPIIITGNKLFGAGSIKEIKAEAAKLKSEIMGEVKKAPKTPGGEASTSAPSIDTEPPAAEFQAPGQDFKLWRATEQLIKEYATRLGEDKFAIPSRTEGVFYPGTENIFMRGANNIFVAAHEITHFIDKRTDWFKKLMVVTGQASNGNPIYDKATAPMRKLLTEFYLEYYPGASASAPLKKRIKEGVAMLVQKAIETPALMETEKWAPLFKEILTPDGKYKNLTLISLVKDGRKMMDQYRSLDPLEKVGARVTAADRKRNIDTLFTTADKAIEQQFDDLHKFRVMADEVALTNSPTNPYNAMQALRYIGALQNNALTAGHGLSVPTAEGIRHIEQKNIADLFKEIGNNSVAHKFDYWLIARRVRSGYQKLEEIRQELLSITEGAYDAKNPNAAALQAWIKKQGELDPERQAGLLASIRGLMKNYRSTAQILKNDNIGEDIANAAYEAGLKDFPNIQKWAEIHDNIYMRIIDMQAASGRLTPEMAAYLRSTKGAYASFARDILTMQTEAGAQVQKGMGPLGFLKKRKGGEQAFKGPLRALIDNWNESVKQALVQNAKNKIYDMVQRNEEYFAPAFQRVPLKVSVGKDGEIEFPQLQDPNIIMARKNGKYKPLAVLDRSLLQIMNDNMLSPGVVDAAEKVISAISRTFVKGTTGTYPMFAAINIPMDTVSAAVQSHTGYKPFYDQIRSIIAIVKDPKSKQAEYFQEYMLFTGGRQTLAHMYDNDRSAEEAYKYLTGQRDALNKISDGLEYGLDILSTPSKLSEDWTRGQEYINARMAGYDVMTALEMAGSVTGSFHHRGTSTGPIGRLLVHAVPYWNSSKQTLAQMMRATNTPEGRKRMAIAVAILTAGMIYSSYAIRTASPAQRRALRAKHPSERAMAIWYPLPGAEARAAGRLGRIRVPENYASPANLINMIILEAIKEDNFTAGEYVDAATAWVPDQYNIADWSRMLFSRLPWIIAPAAGVAANVRTFPKVMPLTSKELQRLPLAEQKNENTSKVAELVSKAIGKQFDLNPIEVDYLIEGYGGGRTTRFATGRMGYRNITNNFYQDLHLNNTRDMEWFMKLNQAVNQFQDLYREKVKTAAAEKRVDIKFPEDATAEELTGAAIEAGVKVERPKELGKMMKYKGRINGILGRLRRYRFFSRVKNPGPAAKAEIYAERDAILDEIDQLRQMYDEDNP